MFYIWIGEKETTVGSVNVRSGNRSLHGDLLEFNTREERDHFFNNAYSRKIHVTMERTNKSDAKSKYFAGLNAEYYVEYLHSINNNNIIQRWNIETYHC